MELKTTLGMLTFGLMLLAPFAAAEESDANTCNWTNNGTIITVTGNIDGNECNSYEDNDSASLAALPPAAAARDACSAGVTWKGTGAGFGTDILRWPDNLARPECTERAQDCRGIFLDVQLVGGDGYTCQRTKEEP